MNIKLSKYNIIGVPAYNSNLIVFWPTGNDKMSNLNSGKPWNWSRQSKREMWLELPADFEPFLSANDGRAPATDEGGAEFE